MLPEVAGIDAKRSYTMNILHITDLHFGTDRSITERDERHLALEELIVTVQGLDPSWAPSVVCVSGDLAFAGRPSDYSQFGDWIKRLLTALNLGVERLVVCPGNHDIERAVATTFARPGTPEEADRCLSVPLAPHYEKAFQNYTEFCKALGIPSLAFGDQESYLTGVRVLDGVRFVSMNSSWFCRDNTDHQQLWIGIPLLRHLEASNQWPKQDIPCMVLLHHPREDFNPQEIHAYGNRPNVYDYICERCDILLSGHTHGEVREPDQIAGRALVFTGGATYVGSDYNNSFQILRLQGNSLDYRAFVFDPRKRNWTSAGEAKHRRLGSPVASSSLDAPAPAPIEDWRSKAAGDARRVRDSKSRAASPSGNLPPLIQRGVTILRVETKGLSPEQAKVPDHSESFPLYNAVRTTPGRKVLLLGDIGSGKSTLVCEFVERSLSESPTSLAFIVPATSLSVSPNLTLKALLGQVSAYFGEQIAPTSDALDVQSVLGQGTEVTLAIDGLDEMSVSSASLLLSKLATATEHWSNLQIVATSRPIELQGIDYQAWNVLSTLSVNAAERRELLQNELTSLGSARNISEEADELESQIARSETVSALFSSPLAIRLFTPVLRKSGVSATVTLGELLLDVLNERLSGWNQRDLKPHQFSALEAALPSPDSRLRLLGEALASTPEESDTRRDAFVSRFEASSTLAANPAKGAVAKEAFDSFVLAGILSSANVVSFPLQAFREMCVAYWLVQKLEEGSEQEIMDSRWRDVSFAAAVLRRSTSFSKYRDIFERYITSLLQDVSGVFAAASVVLESQDQHLALSFIEGLKKLGQHPFNRSGGIDRDDSSKAVAASMRLAGNAGFDWFFSEYLDPRYPVRFAGSAILDWVFAEWLAQVRDTLTADQLDKLKTLARPHIDASTFQVHGIIARLSTVVPEAFSSEERVYFSSTLLADMRYRARALEAIDREFACDPATTESLLVGRINQGFNDGGLIAAILIDRQPGVPPLDLIRAVLRSATSSRVNKTIEAALATIKDRLTEPTWVRLLRWLTFDSDRSVAASAAIFANDIEPQPSALIRKPLLDALHDGAYVWRAEPLLRKAVDEGGTGQVHWLANEIAHADRMMGGYSGWWRIFLANLEKTGADAPVVLADALGGLGPFLLARNPEIRQRFKELLQGAHGDAYRTELRSQLDAVGPRVRLAAAAILTTCDPKGEARALRVAVRAQDEWRTHDWHEWFDMALTFSYGPGPLTALEAELPRFGDSARSYAFRLLFQNDTGIETRQPDALVHALLSFYSTTDKERAFLLSSRGRLETALASHDADRTKRAAALLLELGQLSLETEARAWIAMAEASLTQPAFEKAATRVLKDEPFAQAVESEGSQSIGEGVKPLLLLLSRAIRGTGSWKDVLWRFFMSSQRSLSHEEETYGLWTLRFGKEHPQQGASIGLAAKELLADSMLQQSQNGESVQWIALLADEFAGISKTELEKALITGQTIDKQAACAVIARLGYTPQQFRGRSRELYIGRGSVHWHSKSKQEVVETLIRYSRPTEVLPSNACDVILEALLGEPPTEEEFTLIRAEGENGAILKVALAFGFNLPPDIGALVSSMGMGMSIWEQQSGCFQTLVSIWRYVLGSVSMTGSPHNEELVQGLESLLSQGRERTHAATALLRLGKPLPGDQLMPLMEDFVQKPGASDDFLDALIPWLQSPIEPEVRQQLSNAIDHALRLLDQKSWDSTELGNHDYRRFLTLPLCSAFLSGEFTETARQVFYRGVKFAAAHPPQPGFGDFSALLYQLSPLLPALPQAAVGQLLLNGKLHQDPIVRSVCAVILAAGKAALSNGQPEDGREEL
jgi:hypothetical protein